MEEKISKILLSINNLPYNRYQEVEALSFLRAASIEEIWRHHPLVDGYYDADTMTDEIAVIEPYLAIKAFKEQGYEDNQIEILYDRSYFIYNESLYEIEESQIKKIDIQNILWMSFRESWHHPFYKILKILLESNNSKLYKPNMETMENVGCMNKFYCIDSLYPKRAEYLGDIIIPYNISRKNYEAFFSFVKEHLGDEIVLKQDCIQEGGGVMIKRADDKENYKILDAHKTRSRELFITPLLTIQKEYRCYFSKSEQEIKIFSIKERINRTDKEALLQKENLKIYKNIDVEWSVVEDEEFKKASDIAKDILQYLNYNFGALEFALTTENKIVVFEINQMAGPLPFSGKDLEGINRYYREMVRLGVEKKTETKENL